MRLANPPFAFAGLLLILAATGARAATCVWNSPTGNFNVAANWTGCADAPGPSTRKPGLADVAVIANGIAQVNSDQGVAELELAPGGVLSVAGSALPSVTISTALRFNGGSATTVLGTNQLRLVVAAGATGTLLAPTTLDNATFVDNSGTLHLGSASGVALTLAAAARIDNLAGGVVTFVGGNSRLDILGTSGSAFENHAGGTVTVNGSLQAGKPAPQSGVPSFNNFGDMTVSGPGTLSFTGGNGRLGFLQGGSVTVTNATIACRPATGDCLWSDVTAGPPTNAVTTLDGGTIDCGGPANVFTISSGSSVRGAGTLDCAMTNGGTLAPGAAAGAPYGTLNLAGDLTFGLFGALDADLAGNTSGNYDRVVSAGNVYIGDSGRPDGQGTLVLRLAPGYAPPLGETVPVLAYASVFANASFSQVDANGPLDYASRFDPTQMVVFPAPRLTYENASLIEGSSGSAIMTFNLRLSQPSSLTVTAQSRDTNGTATEGLPPTGDFNAGVQNISFAPGEVLRTATATIHGDTVVEADQSFVMALSRFSVQNAAFGNGRRGSLVAVGTILTDDLPPGTRYVLAASGDGPTGVRRYTSDGVYLDTFASGLTGGFNPNTGLCFSPVGDVLATRFGQDVAGPRLFSRFGAVLAADFSVGPGLAFNSHESCVYDAAGNVYIGQAGFNDLQTDAQVPVLKFSPTGALLDSFVMPTGERGTDWIELSANQCTLYYTSEDTTVRRYNLCTRTPMPHFAENLTPPCYALRLRPNSELMVACQDAVHRLSPQGANLQTYPRLSLGETNAQGLFALNLDPDGTSFWTAGGLSGKVYRVDIETGAVLTTITGVVGGVSGLAVYDELSESDVLLVDGFEDAPVARVPAKSFTPPSGLEDPHYALPKPR